MCAQMVESGEEVIFSYDVVFKMSNIRWASRWDTYLLMMDDQIHWFSIVNSLMIVLFLSGMVAMIMLVRPYPLPLHNAEKVFPLRRPTLTRVFVSTQRTLHRDISKYNQLDQDEAAEETGWKLVHGDVFRPPAAFGALTVYVGTGVQLLGMIVVTLVFAVLGFLSPANRGGLMTAMLLLFALMGLFAGHSASRLFKMFQVRHPSPRCACAAPRIPPSHCTATALHLLPRRRMLVFIFDVAARVRLGRARTGRRTRLTLPSCSRPWSL
jgi:transmembrane 9 superfamily protein 2/4